MSMIRFPGEKRLDSAMTSYPRPRHLRQLVSKVIAILIAVVCMTLCVCVCVHACVHAWYGVIGNYPSSTCRW